MRQLKQVREYDVVDLSTEELVDFNKSGPWLEIRSGHTITHSIGAAFGLGEEVVGWLTYADGVHIVGSGEALRPFNKLWEGDDADEAAYMWKSAILGLAWDVVDEEGRTWTP
jgi:hypothetical protein